MVKLFPKDWSNPFFANDASLEQAALLALAPFTIAPKFIAAFEINEGQVVLYRRVDGQSSSSDAFQIGRTLGSLHRTETTPAIDAPIAPAPKEAFHHILDGLPGGCPAGFEECFYDDFWLNSPSNPMRLLHFDPTPANFAVSSDRAFLFDWQTPKFGDPCHDISIYFSPSMRLIYGYPLATQHEIGQFFDGYGDPTTEKRWRETRHWYHAVLALYAHWRGVEGMPNAVAAVTAELDALRCL